MATRDWAKRFEERTKSNPLLVLLFFLSTSLSAAIILAGAGITVYGWYEDHCKWRDREYKKLQSLHAGFTRKKFEAVLGEPVFDRRSDDGRYREQVFRRREHWVQTVSDPSGTVKLYAVTACGHDFRPKFEIPGAVNDPAKPARVKLQAARLASVIEGPRAQIIELDYFAPGATANARFYDAFYGGNPSSYKTFVWGVNDICPDWRSVSESAFDRGLLPLVPEAPIFRGALPKAPSWAKRFRRGMSVNTYAETAPLFQLKALPRPFQVGPDRILLRTAN